MTTSHLRTRLDRMEQRGTNTVHAFHGPEPGETEEAYEARIAEFRRRLGPGHHLIIRAVRE